MGKERAGSRSKMGRPEYGAIPAPLMPAKIATNTTIIISSYVIILSRSGRIKELLSEWEGMTVAFTKLEVN